MYLNMKDEVIRPPLEYLDETFETFISRMNSAVNVPVLPKYVLTARKMQAHPHMTYTGNIG